MTVAELMAAVEAAKTETRAALETMYAALNPGQQQKILKDETVQSLFSRYGVEYDG